jgi:lipopolysaccharide/colanic/teichoic acid biosynthesis glycosyltransferase
MRHTNTQNAAVVLKLILPLAMGTAFFGALYLRFYSGLLPVRDLPGWPAYSAYFVLSLTLWQGLEARFALTAWNLETGSLGRWTWSLVRLDLLTLALASCGAFFWRGYSFSRFTVAVFWLLHAVLCVCCAWAVRAWLVRKRRTASVWALLTGDDASLEDLVEECVPAGVAVVSRRFPDASAMLEFLRDFEAPASCREVLLVLPAREAGQLAALSGVLERQLIPASIALAEVPFAAARATRSFVVLSAGPAAPDAFDYVFSKRLMDIALSALGILLTAPLMVAIALGILLRSGHPVLLAQRRVGRAGRRFRLFKFRTLPVASLAASDRQWAASAPDGLGRFLRRTGFDELPQLFNVLCGRMSLVGPRPERPHFVERFRRELPFYSTRHRLQVGLTGWAQVHGLRGDTSIASRVEHDLYYLRHWSLSLDWRILWMTLQLCWRELWSLAPGAQGAPSARHV